MQQKGYTIYRDKWSQNRQLFILAHVGFNIKSKKMFLELLEFETTRKGLWLCLTIPQIKNQQKAINVENMWMDRKQMYAMNICRDKSEEVKESGVK